MIFFDNTTFFFIDFQFTKKATTRVAFYTFQSDRNLLVFSYGLMVSQQLAQYGQTLRFCSMAGI